MQSLREIRQMFSEAGLRPNKRLGQCFLIDKNLLGKLLELGELTGDETVLEVGAATGSLTEELLALAAKVVAVEADRGLSRILQRRLGGRSELTFICADVLASKHEISPAVLQALGPSAHMVANLPYKIATPLLMECLLSSWRASVKVARTCLFKRLTFTVQREVADRLAAAAGGKHYGPASVLVSLLGRVKTGPSVPASAFWPQPKVASRILRIDFDESAAGRLIDAEVLTETLAVAFGKRRKQIGSAFRMTHGKFTAEALGRALQAAKIDPTFRAERITPQQYLVLANAVAAGS